MTLPFVRTLAASAVACAALGCTTGEGTGDVTSERLFVENCHNGPFDLQPTFFGANPGDDTLIIRVQRGDQLQELSDGISVLVTEVSKIRGDDGGPGMLDQDISVGLPRGVAPPGVPIEFDPDPPLVSIALYLNDSCHAQVSTVYALEGTIRFSALFSGDITEESADNRLTEAEFSAVFGDPRELTPGGLQRPEVLSLVEGNFRFFFERGQPAQPFP